MQSIQITIDLDPKDGPWRQIRANLCAFNQAQVGVYDAQPSAVLARRADKTLVGGMYGWLQWGWLLVDLAWVHENYRGIGVGRQLLHHFEAHAKAHGITRVRLNTASFQGGLAFYQRCGYEIYAALPIVSPDGHEHTDYFMKKSL